MTAKKEEACPHSSLEAGGSAHHAGKPRVGWSMVVGEAAGSAHHAGKPRVGRSTVVGEVGGSTHHVGKPRWAQSRGGAGGGRQEP